MPDDDDVKDNSCSYFHRAIRHLDGKEYRGRPLVVEESRARPPNSTKVFVGNLSATCSADDLHGLFSTFGRVLDCDKVKGELEIFLPILLAQHRYIKRVS